MVGGVRVSEGGYGGWGEGYLRGDMVGGLKGN